MSLRVTLLAGGVGGAKMAEGFYALPGVALTVIGNVADDEEFHGLWVSPDIDTLTYTLSGRINLAQGWGVADEGLRALETLKALGQDTWMTLGDRDLGLHIYRTMRRRRGDRPSTVASDIARAFGLSCEIVLPTDDVVQTRVRTAAGWQSFQEYFVRDRHAPEVLEVTYQRAKTARATPEALEALGHADVIVVAPSNPILSIAPILAVPALRSAMAAAKAPRIAISPLIGGAAVKGPAAEIMQASGYAADASGVAAYYADLVDHLLIDTQDRHLQEHLIAPAVHVADIMMRELADKERLARVVLALANADVAA